MKRPKISTLFAMELSVKHFLLFALLVLGYLAPGKLAAQGKVQVDVEPSVKEMEENRTKRRKANSDKVRGYRIMIGFFAGRAEAENLKQQAKDPFGAKFGVNVLYDEPNFKVYVGQFTNADDADAALVEIRKKFPSATRISDIIRRPAK
jgi:hypothetical protein